MARRGQPAIFKTDDLLDCLYNCRRRLIDYNIISKSRQQKKIKFLFRVNPCNSPL